MCRPPEMPRHTLKRLHLFFGLVGLAAFLFTGLFMDQRLDHLVGMADGPRALYRSGHIYILFTALLNLLLAVYLVASPDRIVRIFQAVGSVLLLATPVFFVHGFFIETPLAAIERPMTREGIYWALGGVLLHGTAGLLSWIRGNSVVEMPVHSSGAPKE